MGAVRMRVPVVGDQYMLPPWNFAYRPTRPTSAPRSASDTPGSSAPPRPRVERQDAPFRMRAPVVGDQYMLPPWNFAYRPTPSAVGDTLCVG